MDSATLDLPTVPPGDDAPADAPVGFAALGLAPELVRTVTSLGFEEPTAIQERAIPPLVAGRDVLGQAATGTGKTAAFALPIIQRIVTDPTARGAVRALVLVPTRELAMQVAQAIERFAFGSGARVLAVFGGSPFGPQRFALARGVEIVVATPGRALDHLTRGTLDLGTLRMLVLDEADEMLDLGFADELDAIFERMPAERQTALFSATMPPRILGIAKEHLRDPERITIAREVVPVGEAPRVREVAYPVERRHKVASLVRILDVERPASAIVFCRTRMDVDELGEALTGRGYRAEALHGGLSQEQRDRVMKRFRDGSTQVLVATDVAARGLDIAGLSHVVNFDVPSSPSAYTHRIGRTGRAGRDGVAITLVESRERRLLQAIEHTTGRRVATAPIPTLAELRSLRLASAREAFERLLAEEDLDPYLALARELAEAHDPALVAAAGLRLADTSRSSVDETEIPAVSFEAPAATRRTPIRQPSDPSKPPRLFIGLGRKNGIRPADLVGAIANETKLGPKEIGGIEITERFSLIEIPADAMDDVVRALRKATIRGKKPLVRRDRDA